MLPSRFMTLRDDKFLKDNEIVPVRSFKLRSRSSNFLNPDMSIKYKVFKAREFEVKNIYNKKIGKYE